MEPNYITEVKSNPFNVLPGNAARPSRRRALQQAGGSREPTDPRYPQNGIDYGQWWLRKVGAPQAWATTTGSKQVGGRPACPAAMCIDWTPSCLAIQLVELPATAREEPALRPA